MEQGIETELLVTSKNCRSLIGKRINIVPSGDVKKDDRDTKTNDKKDNKSELPDTTDQSLIEATKDPSNNTTSTELLSKNNPPENVDIQIDNTKSSEGEIIKDNILNSTDLNGNNLHQKEETSPSQTVKSNEDIDNIPNNTVDNKSDELIESFNSHNTKEGTKVLDKTGTDSDKKDTESSLIESHDKESLGKIKEKVNPSNIINHEADQNPEQKNESLKPKTINKDSKDLKLNAVDLNKKDKPDQSKLAKKKSEKIDIKRKSKEKNPKTSENMGKKKETSKPDATLDPPVEAANAETVAEKPPVEEGKEDSTSQPAEESAGSLEAKEEPSKDVNKDQQSAKDADVIVNKESETPIENVIKAEESEPIKDELSADKPKVNTKETMPSTNDAESTEKTDSEPEKSKENVILEVAPDVSPKPGASEITEEIKPEVKEDVTLQEGEEKIEALVLQDTKPEEKDSGDVKLESAKSEEESKASSDIKDDKEKPSELELKDEPEPKPEDKGPVIEEKETSVVENGPNTTEDKLPTQVETVSEKPEENGVLDISTPDAASANVRM